MLVCQLHLLLLLLLVELLVKLLLLLSRHSEIIGSSSSEQERIHAGAAMVRRVMLWLRGVGACSDRCSEIGREL